MTSYRVFEIVKTAVYLLRLRKEHKPDRQRQNDAYQALNATNVKKHVAMNSANISKNEPYVIDLCKIKGKGEFQCPKCGTKISPDDLTEDTYTILETQVKQDHLDRVILQCNKCRSKLQLIGFETTEHPD